jgi:hypothetical protein
MTTKPAQAVAGEAVEVVVAWCWGSGGGGSPICLPPFSQNQSGTLQQSRRVRQLTEPKPSLVPEIIEQAGDLCHRVKPATRVPATHAATPAVPALLEA